MALSAAELQKRHQLEGAPDPFPSLGGASPARPRAQQQATPANGGLDSSEDAFPSLGASSAPAPAAKTKPAISAWGAKSSAVKSGVKGFAPGGLGRAPQATSASHPFTETFTIPTNELATGKAVTDTMKKVQTDTGAVVESSTQMSTGLKTFLVKASDPQRLTLARQIIQRGLSKPVVLEVEVPISTIGTIIGPKGSTLKGITEDTGTKIDIPRRDSLPAWDAREAREAARESEDYDSDEEIEEPQVTITISGTSAAAKDARERVFGLISHRISQGSASIKNIPSNYYPFIAGPRGANTRRLEEEIGDGEVKIHVPPPAVWRAIQEDEEEDASPKERDLAIKLKGDKEKVKAVVAEIQRQYENLVGSLKEFGIVVPKRQHRYLIGEAADDILEKTGCIIDLPPASDRNEQVMMRGPQSGLLKAIELAMSKAEEVAVETIDVGALARLHTSDALNHAKKVARFLQRSSRLKNIGDQYNNVKVYAPRPAAIAQSGKVIIEVVGEDKNEVTKARDDVLAAVKSITPSAITTAEIDPAVHSLLIGRKGAKISQFEAAHNVTSIFPPAEDDSSEVSLVYVGTDLPSDKKQREAKLKEVLGAAVAALQELAKNAADVKTETMTVDKKWHRSIIGPGGTVLNALIGEDQLVTVRLGSAPGKQTDGNEDEIVVRGPSSEVDRVVAQINQVVEDAKNDDIVNGYTPEFEVDKKHVAHLVGAQGAAVNKLRDQLGVRVNLEDTENKKGKKVTRCTIIGRKEGVEEAKRRIIAQIEKLEDETTEVVKIKKEIQPALIGTGGKYAIRLEEKYGVKLSFPRDGKDQQPDEVIIRGGKKGVASAKAELLEAAAYEAESRQEAKFTVPAKAVAFIVGKSGSTINQIKDDTGAHVDIDKAGEGGKTTVTVRGDKKAITAAKAAVLELVEQFGDEVTVTMSIEPQYHATLIGQGGSKLRSLIEDAGGPSEGFKQAGLVTFPRPADNTNDEVRLRGDRAVVNAIKAALEKEVETLQSNITRGVVVPSSAHATKIGRGGAALQDLQRRTGATIHFPGSRGYKSAGTVENEDELEEADAADIVKVSGTKEAVAAATEVLQQAVPERQRRERTGNADLATRTTQVPAKYHHAIAGQQNLMRQIRSVHAFLTMPPAPPKPTLAPVDDVAAKTARIDLDAEEDEHAFEIRENYAGADDTEQEWTIRAKEADLDKAQAVLDRAIEAAAAASHVGLLTGLPRSAFPRIIGSKGATISRLRAETGADITVGKDDDLITITGDEESVKNAKEAILSIVSRQGSRF